MLVPNFGKIALASVFGLCIMLSSWVNAAVAEGPQTLLAQAERRGCLARRDMIRAVSDGKARPLSEIRERAEEAGGGEMISADLCPRNGGLVYVVTVLAGTGKVVYVTVDAAAGRLVEVR